MQDSGVSERNEQSLIVRAQSYLQASVKDHPVALKQAAETFDIFKGWRMGTRALVACLLLPMMRADLVPDSELIVRFGGRPVALARMAYRLMTPENSFDTRRKPPPRVLQAEKLRRLFLAAYTDVDAVLLCAADHLASASWLNQASEAERQAWAQENTAVFVPITEMLGLWSYRHVLADLSLSLTDKKLYEKFEDKVIAYCQRHEALFNQIAPELDHLLSLQGIKGAEIRLHETTPANLYRRHQQSTPDESGILRIDLLLENERDCYLTLGIIHNRWSPVNRPITPTSPVIDERFFDTLAAPRYNGYRCLLTTVTADENRQAPKLAEFRIRTKAMEQVNIRGIVAARIDPIPVRNAWWNDHTAGELLNTRDTNTLTGDICVFTGNGEVVYPLRKGTTIIDLAFKINPALAPYAREIWLNGIQVGHDFELRHRDLVEINYDIRYPALKPEWEDYARTSSARASIRRFLKQQDRSPNRGRALIDIALTRELNLYGMRYPKEKTESALSRIARRFNCPSVEMLYLRAAEGEIPPDDIAAAMIEDELVGHIVLENGDHWPAEKIRIAPTWRAYQREEQRPLDSTGRVIPGVEIVGQITGKDMLTVFRRDNPLAPPPEQAISLRWRTPKSQRESVEISVNAPPRSSSAGKVLEAIYTPGSENNEVVLHRFQSDMQDGSLNINLLVDVPSLDSIERMNAALKQLQQNETISDFKIWQLFPGQKIMIAGKSDKRQQNPYSLNQVRDSSMFFGREDEIARVIDCIMKGQTFVILYGQKRIGKTSLMGQLETLLPQSCNVLPVIFDAHSLSPFDTVPFLLGLADATSHKIDAQFKRPDERRGLRLRERDLQSDPYGAFAAWVNRVQKQLKGHRLLFMIDEFTRAEEEIKRGKLQESFFDGLQWLAGSKGIGFLLCVHDTIMRHGSYSWGLLQRGQPIRLDFLDRAAASRLIRQPLERLYQIDNEIVETILDLTSGHPYFINGICLELVSRMSRMSYDRVGQDDIQSAISTLLRSSEHYFNHYRSTLDEFTWKVLRTISELSGRGYEWVSSETLRAALEHGDEPPPRWQVSHSIGELFRSGLIDARDTVGRVAYRVSIRLFHIGLDWSTKPSILEDLKKD